MAWPDTVASGTGESPWLLSTLLSTRVMSGSECDRPRSTCRGGAEGRLERRVDVGVARDGRDHAVLLVEEVGRAEGVGVVEVRLLVEEPAADEGHVEGLA
jgi:hypothetical protein